MDGRPAFTEPGPTGPVTLHRKIPAFRGSAGPFPLHCFATRLRRAPTIGRRPLCKTHCPHTSCAYILSKCVLAFLSVFFSALCLSCSDSEPSVVKAEHTVVFEYAESSSAPSVRLSVFVQPSASVLRAGEIRAVHAQTGMEWVCASPVVFHGSNGSDYAGCPSFFPPYNSDLPQGIYYIYYKDKAGRECEAEFSLNYTPDFCTKPYAELPHYVANPDNERIALYNADGILIYCGKRRDEWKDSSAIRAEYVTAEKMRVCYASGDLFFMLPLEALQK